MKDHTPGNAALQQIELGYERMALCDETLAQLRAVADQLEASLAASRQQRATRLEDVRLGGLPS